MLFVIGILAAIAVLGAAFGCYWVAFYNPESRHDEAVISSIAHKNAEIDKRIKSLYAEMNDLAFERVYIRSHDGLLLSGRYYHVQSGAPLQIQFHGYRGSGLRDLCGGNGLARSMGHNTLVVDQRAHGRSQGSTMTFGIMERHDCLNWVRYAVNRFGGDTRIILTGVSMGAATVLMASELALPANVVGIIADCSYSSPGAIIRKVCADMRFPPRLVYSFVVLGALLYGHFPLWNGSPAEAVTKAKVPILLIHGEDDRYVPCAMSQEIFDRCSSPCFLETFPGASHGISYIVDSSRYEKVVKEFIDFCFNRVSE